MARFRVRDHDFNWLDCMEYDMFIRSEAGDWAPLEPDKFAVRGVYGYRWYNIDDAFDPKFDDPCSNIETGECGGGPTSQVKGSGDGYGSQGPLFDPILGYPPGYDLPDAGRTGFGERIVNLSPAGRAIRRPGIKLIESYDPVGHASKSGLGTWENPNVAFASVHSRGAVITETIYAMPPHGGYVEFLFASYQESGISVDVYHMGQRVVSTCGRVGGRSRLKFELDATQEDLRLMIRVRADQGSNWSMQVFPPSLATPPDRGNLPLDHQAAYNVIGFPDIINPRYIGTPIFPAPCHATVWPLAERILDSNAFEYYHYVGTESGWMYVDYTSWDNLDFIEVYQAGKRIATTLDAQTERGFLRFYYDPENTLNYDLMVRVVAKDFGRNESLKSVYYSMYCPGERGARTFRHPCETYSVYSAGHPYTEDNFQLIRHTDQRAILVQLDSGSFTGYFELFDANHTVIDTEHKDGIGTLEAWFDPPQVHNERAQVAVRATSAIGCDWQYFVYCPIQPPKVLVPDYIVPYRCIEGTQTQVEDTDGYRPQYTIGPWDWKLVVQDRAGSNLINYHWKDNYEYTIVARIGDSFWTRNFFTLTSLAPANTDMALALLDRGWFALGGQNIFNPAAPRWIRMHKANGFVHLIYERPMVLSNTQPGVPDTNSWQLMGPHHRWEYGYEYVVFINDSFGQVELAQTRIILPEQSHQGPRPNPWWFVEHTNSTTIRIHNDGRLEATSHIGQPATINIMRRPLFMDDGSGASSLRWRRDFYTDNWPEGQRTFEWDYGREYVDMNWHSGAETSAVTYKHHIPLHMLDIAAGRAGNPPGFPAWDGNSCGGSFGASGFSGGKEPKASRMIRPTEGGRGTWQVLSRPFRYKEQLEIMEHYRDLARIL